MKKLITLMTALLFACATLTQTVASPVSFQQHLTKSGKPDKRYKENKHLTKAGKPDMRFKSNNPNAGKKKKG